MLVHLILPATFPAFCPQQFPGTHFVKKVKCSAQEENTKTLAKAQNLLFCHFTSQHISCLITLFIILITCHIDNLSISNEKWDFVGKEKGKGSYLVDPCYLYWQMQIVVTRLMQEVVIDDHPAAHFLAPFALRGSQPIQAATAQQKMWPLNGHNTMLIKQNFNAIIPELWLVYLQAVCISSNVKSTQ